MKPKTLKILTTIWRIIKFIVTLGMSYEDKYPNNDGNNTYEN